MSYENINKNITLSPHVRRTTSTIVLIQQKEFNILPTRVHIIVARYNVLSSTMISNNKGTTRTYLSLTLISNEGKLSIAAIRTRSTAHKHTLM